MKLFNAILSVLILSGTAFAAYTILSKSKYSSFHRASSLPEIVLRTTGYEATYRAVVKLKDADDQFVCSAVVVAKNYAITAAHCVVKDGALYDKQFSIYDAMGQDTTVKATAVAAYERMDIALLNADFSAFEAIPFNPNTLELEQSMGEMHFICGFPLNVKVAKCTRFIPFYYSTFYVGGRGHIVPGFSGGAVINPTYGTLVGIAVAVAGSGDAIVTPITGILDLFEVPVRTE